MFDCMKKKTKPQVEEPAKPIPTVGDDDNVPFVFVVGHNESSQGAVNYLGESEWIFNQRIAKKASKKLASHGVRSAIIFRNTGSYSSQVASVKSQVERIGAKFAFCLHFNDASSIKASGCEVLIRNTSSPDDEMVADYITDLLNERFGIPERGDDGIKIVSSGHGGYGMLNGLYEVGCLAVLPEPCFCRNREEAKKIFENEDAYVDVLVESAYKFCTGNKLK